jgi:hypothetical protein
MIQKKIEHGLFLRGEEEKGELIPGKRDNVVFEVRVISIILHIVERGSNK